MTGIEQRHRAHQRGRRARRTPGSARRARFTVALLNALHAYKREFVSDRAARARRPASIEIDILGEPIGKQDQYIAAYGGITRVHLRHRRHGRGRAPAAHGRGLDELEIEPRHLLLGRRARGVERCSSEQAQDDRREQATTRSSGCTASRSSATRRKRILLAGRRRSLRRAAARALDEQAQARRRT